MVQIITDSAADFEAYEYEEIGVKCIPLCVTFEDKEYQENIDLSKEMFYQLLKEKKDFPRTSQPSPCTVECALQEAMDAGDEAVIISISSGFSGFYQNLLMVKNMMKYDNCYVIDSKTGTGGQRILVEQAAKLRDAGKSAMEIVKEIEGLRSRIVLYACMDTLEYLHRGGRISSTAYTVGSLAHVKPILRISTEGLVEIPAKTMGMRKGMDFMCKRLEQQTPDDRYPLYVMFTGDRTNGEKLAMRLKENGYPISDKRIINVGAAIGSHIGPNACGLVYIKKE